MIIKYLKLTLLTLFVAIAMHPSPVFSLMQSSNYQIQFDSVNTGGNNSSSTNYKLEDTVGEVASGNSSSASFQMRAGYQQMNSSYITLTTQSTADLDNISGISNNFVSTSTDATVITDSYGGYQLSVVASTSPAMTSGTDFFEDYQSAGPDPDYTFLILPEQSLFAFAVSGNDVVGRYLNNGVFCNSGTNSTPETCWDGFSTSTKIVSIRNSSNHPAGTVTRFDYRAQIGSNKFQESGAYSANIVITAIAL